jgi:protein involved in polysaccharide export with SLBB domain/beta-lactamase regulating signal transducer with metallopeptidase domain
VLLHSLWIDTAVAALLAAAMWLLRRSPATARYAAGCAGMALMVVLPVFAASLIRPAPAAPVPNSMAAESSSARARPSPAAIAVRLGPAVTPADLATADGSATAAPTDPARRRWLAWAVAGWLLGVAGLSLRHLLGWAGARRLARRCDEPPDDWRQRLAELAGRLRVAAPVRLRISQRLHVPAVIGWLRPVILVPAAALTDLTPQQLESLLLHELAHVRRHDYLVNLLQTAAETLLFYHPAAWWASQVVRREREHCCDDLAADRCGNRVLYARALAAMEALRPAPGGRLALGATDGSGRGTLLVRVRRVVGLPDARPDRRTPALAALFAVTTGLLLTTVAPRLIAQEQREPSHRDAKPPESNPAAAAAAAGGLATQPADPIEPQDLKEDNSDYRIQANDLLSVTLSELTGPGKETVKQTRVTEGGSISLPLIGLTTAAGLTVPELEKAIAQEYRRQNLVRNMPVSVTIVEARGRRFSMVGGVQRPNEYTIFDSKMRLLDAIAMAAGPMGEVKSVLIIRQPGQTKPGQSRDEKQPKPPLRRLRVDGAKLMAGDPDANLFVRPRDTIEVIVDARAPQGPAADAPKVVRIVVSKDGTVRLEDKEASWDDIAVALEKLPDHPSTVVELSAGSDDVTVGRLFGARANAQELVRKYGFKQLNVIGIGQIPARGAGAGRVKAAGFGEVFIGGRVVRPGAYMMGPDKGITLRQLVISAGGADKDTSDGAKVTVLRPKPDGSGGENVIRTTLKELFAPDSAANVPLKPNDQIMVGGSAISGDRPAEEH